ncbi:MAG TPA: aldehyde dehydrogenase family protein [Bdellovibrionota bacterium]|jgi:succinylglutamic semialdehyde dehydrogenase|nr:aldehyde dehydrogenase family protein [Bdellovibrionota bacterium]
MSTPKHPFVLKGDYVAGEFVQPKDPNGQIKSVSPADFTDVLGSYAYGYAHVDLAVEAAGRAFRTWKRMQTAERGALLKRYQEALKRHAERLAEAMAREVGKPVWEAKTEVNAMVNKVDVTINESAKLVEGYKIPGIMPGIAGVCRYKPLGVMAVIGPFNFPGHLANGHIVPALLTGNTVIFKPSEKSPMVGQIMAECFAEAGFPAGVFNVVQGEKEVGRRLCVHEGVAGVLFTGSYEVGTRIKQDTLQQHWKLLALEMGGKNAAIVWKDANLAEAIRECLVGAFLTCGQRCSATSRVLVHKDLLDAFVTGLHEKSKTFSIGHPLDDPFMGPIIDAASVDRYQKFQGIAVREGCEIIMRGKSLDIGRQGNYISPSICLVKDASVAAAKKSVYQQTELFAPNVAITPVEDLDHAIELANCSQYGLAFSVFTRDAQVYENCTQDLDCGVLNWNRTTVGASSRLPFGGTKKSGNHFPTALSATLYCTYPVASLEAPAEGLAPTQYPGLS